MKSIGNCYSPAKACLLLSTSNSRIIDSEPLYEAPCSAPPLFPPDALTSTLLFSHHPSCLVGCCFHFWNTSRITDGWESHATSPKGCPCLRPHWEFGLCPAAQPSISPTRVAHRFGSAVKRWSDPVDQGGGGGEIPAGSPGCLSTLLLVLSWTYLAPPLFSPCWTFDENSQCARGENVESKDATKLEVIRQQAHQKMGKPKMTRVEPKMTKVERKMTKLERKMTKVEPKLTKVEPKMTRVEVSWVLCLHLSFCSSFNRKFSHVMNCVFQFILPVLDLRVRCLQSTPNLKLNDDNRFHAHCQTVFSLSPFRRIGLDSGDDS